MCKIHNGIPPSHLPHFILVQTSASNRFQRQHCEKIQTKPSPISMGGHGRRVPFQLHYNCYTRLRNVNAQKAKPNKDIWFQCKKVMVHSTMFPTLLNVQRYNGINWIRNNIKHGTIQTSCHCNPSINPCRKNPGSSTAVG